MTSWIRVPPPALKKRDAEGNLVAGSSDSKEEEGGQQPLRTLFYVTNNDDIYTQFLNFFYAHLYAKSAGMSLAVYDRNNPVSHNISLFKDTFDDISGVKYVDSQMNHVIPVVRRGTQIASHVRGMTREALSEEAAGFFELNDTAGGVVRDFLKGHGFPRQFDVGVVFQSADAITVGQRRGTYVQNYLAALRGFQARSGLANLRIFLASVDSNFNFELRKLADPTWTIYSLPPSKVATSVGSAPTLRMRQEAFTQMMADMIVLQNVPAVLGRMDNSLSRIVALTREEPSSFLAIDGARFTPL